MARSAMARICAGNISGFRLEYLLNAHRQLGNGFITSVSFFDRLAGTDALRKQILSGMKEEDIRASWQEELAAYRQMRAKYIIYK